MTRSLLYQQSVASDLVPPLIEKLVASGIPNLVAAAVCHPGAEKSALIRYSFSPDLRVAAAAADRASEVAGFLRIRDFAKHHAGTKTAKLCAWLGVDPCGQAARIERKPPVGRGSPPRGATARAC
jgi:hypothetical protein